MVKIIVDNNGEETVLRATFPDGEPLGKFKYKWVVKDLNRDDLYYRRGNTSVLHHVRPNNTVQCLIISGTGEELMTDEIVLTRDMIKKRKGRKFEYARINWQSKINKNI